MGDLIVERCSGAHGLFELAHLVEESIGQGHRHLVKLVNEFEGGVNRFDRTGEALYFARKESRIVGVGGVNQDPYSNEAMIGRVRRLYVLDQYRRQGIAKMVMEYIVERAREHFDVLVLKTTNPEADLFYRSIGFAAALYSKDSSHFMILNKKV